MYFIRQTKEPERDALRNFEALSDAQWFDSQEEALRYAEVQGVSQKPRLCPVTTLWCVRWTDGLSGWKIYDQNSMEVVLNKINLPFGVFYSDSWQDGLDRDIFQNGVFLNIQNPKLIKFNDLINY